MRTLPISEGLHTEPRLHAPRGAREHPPFVNRFAVDDVAVARVAITFDRVAVDSVAPTATLCLVNPP